MSHHEDGEGSGSTYLRSAEDAKSERINKVKVAISQLKGEDLSPEEADQLHELLLEKRKTPKSGVVFDA